MAVGTTRVRGLRELQRALKRLSKDDAKAVRDELKDAAEPVRQTAEMMAVREISQIGPRWGQMRLGVTSSSVYIAPKQRNRGGPRRPAFGLRLLGEAMFPALEDHEGYIRSRVEDALDRIADRSSFRTK